MKSLDVSISQALNSYATSYQFVSYIFIFLAKYSQFIVIFLIIYLALQSRKWRSVAAVTVSGIISALIARYLVKSIILLFIQRARPFIVDPKIKQLVEVNISENYQSFPSGHALFFFAFATIIYYYNKRYGMLLFITAILMGIARVVTGVHYATDIISGAILGILTSLFFIFLKKRYWK